MCLEDTSSLDRLKTWAWSLPPDLIRVLASPRASDSGTSYVRSLVSVASSRLLAEMPPPSEWDDPGWGGRGLRMCCEQRRTDSVLVRFAEYADEKRLALLEAERQEKRDLKEQLRKYDVAILKAMDAVGENGLVDACGCARTDT